MRISKFGTGISAVLCACSFGVATPVQAQDAGGGIACGGPYVIARGDTLGAVAGRAYGDPALATVLAEVNRDVTGGNPSNIALGASIMVPCLDAAGNPMAGKPAEASAALDAAIVAEGPLSPEELDALFGPVALFPDPLLNQVLMASTFPLDVVKAGRFLEKSVGISDTDRAAAAKGESWDASVVELASGFPDIITRMNDHIDWTEQAGSAVIAQTDEVLASIQRLRATAQTNGYLTDNEAQTVDVVDNFIYIAPANPEVVYVPTYKSEVVYTTPLSTSSAYNPVYYGGYDDDDWEDALATGAIIFGTAIILDEIFDDDDYWGHGGWDDGDSIDWNNGDINIDRGDINIDNGINIGNGNGNIGNNIGSGNIGSGNIGIGDGRPGFGNNPNRPTTLPARLGGPEKDALAGKLDRTFAPDAASRDAARQKLETRKASGAGTATLPATRPAAKGPAKTLPAAKLDRKPSAAGKPAARPSISRESPKVSKPSAAKRPSAGKQPAKNTAFKTSGGSRAKAGSSRGKASMKERGR